MAEMSLKDQYQLYSSREFGQRVSMAMYRVAREVLEEPTNTFGYSLRVNFARSVLMADADTMIKYGALLLSDPIILNQTTTGLNNNAIDNLILTGIRKMWNPLAGVVPEATGVIE